MNWIIANKEWLFSGIGVVIITAMISLLLKSRKKTKSIQMKQRSGNNSTNIQIGRDFNNGK